MNKETLYWTIGGVVLALLALFAVTRGGGGGGGGGQSVTSTPAVSSADLTSQINNVNTNAADVSKALIAAESSYAQTSSTNSATNFQTILNNGTAQLASVENAATTRFANQSNNAAAEYTSNLNAITQQFGILQQAAVAVDTNNENYQIAHVTSDNAANAARASSKSGGSNWFSTLVGGITSLGTTALKTGAV